MLEKEIYLSCIAFLIQRVQEGQLLSVCLLGVGRGGYSSCDIKEKRRSVCFVLVKRKHRSEGKREINNSEMGVSPPWRSERGCLKRRAKGWAV